MPEAPASEAVYAPLHAHSGYSLLDSACRIADLVAAAAAFRCPALALTDRDSLAGAVAFSSACRAAGIRPVIGAELTLSDGSHLTLLCAADEGYSNLCRLLSRPERGAPGPAPERLPGYADGLLALSGCRRGRVPALLASGRLQEAEAEARRLAAAFGGRFFIELFHHQPSDTALRSRLVALAERLGLRAVPTPNIHYINPGDFRLWQAVASVRTLTLLGQDHPGKPQPGEYHFRPPAEMARIFGPESLRATLEVAGLCAFGFGAGG